MAKTDERQITAVDETTRRTKALEPVELRSARDYTLAMRALDEHAAGLKKLAQKTLEGGYPREGRAILADAEAIEYHIVPAFREQRELPLLEAEDVDKAIARGLRRLVFRAFETLDDPKLKITPELIGTRKDALLQQLGERIGSFSRDLASRAFDEGYAARLTAAEHLAMRSINDMLASG